MKFYQAIFFLFISLCIPAFLFANDCWVISNIKGYAAYADQSYNFIPDGLSNPIMLCFTSEGGKISGTDIHFLKFGNSTLAGYGGNDKGNEMFEIYQIDRVNKKLLYTKSRIGTKTIAPRFSDVVCSYIGEASKVKE